MIGRPRVAIFIMLRHVRPVADERRENLNSKNFKYSSVNDRKTSIDGNADFAVC